MLATCSKFAVVFIIGHAILGVGVDVQIRNGIHMFRPIVNGISGSALVLEDFVFQNRDGRFLIGAA